MSRFKKSKALPEGVVLPKEHQLTFVEQLDRLAKSVELPDATQPAKSLFWVTLGLLAFGLVLQISHASTTQDPSEFGGSLISQVGFRFVGLAALLFGMRLGPSGLRRTIPALAVVALITLIAVYVPGIGATKNGAHRWLTVPGFGFSFQPSEFARIVAILWVADRCLRLGDDVRDMRRGVMPMLRFGLLFFLLIVCETDLGGALLFLACFLCTMWVGGARPIHVAGPLFGFGGAAFLLVISLVSYVRQRIEMWLGNATNDQVARSSEAIASGDWLGVGLGQGLFRNARVPYLESDYVFALAGEELGLVGLGILVALFLAFLWHAMRFALSVRERFDALAAFGLLLSVGLQAMLHMQVVTQLAPPKGMPLPFLSHGGTSLIVSSFAVGLALGAARKSPADAPEPVHDPDAVQSAPLPQSTA